MRKSSIEKKSWGRLPITNKLRSSSFYKKVEVVFNLQKSLDCVPFTKKLMLSSIYKTIEVVFHSKLTQIYLNAFIHIALTCRLCVSDRWVKHIHKNIQMNENEVICQMSASWLTFLNYSGRGGRGGREVIIRLPQLNCNCNYQLKLSLAKIFFFLPTWVRRYNIFCETRDFLQVFEYNAMLRKPYTCRYLSSLKKYLNIEA